MATVPEATGLETPIIEQPGSLDAILQSLGLDQLNPPAPTGGSTENVELKGLTQAIEALAQDVANKFGTLGERLNALENRPLAPQVQNSHGAISFSTSTPAPEARRPSLLQKPGEPSNCQTNGPERLPWPERPLDEVPDYEQVPVWPDEEDDDTSSANSKLFAVSEATDKLLQDSFKKAVPNITRKQWREHYGDPKCPKTRVPKLDKIVKDRLHQETAKLDRVLARIQALTLDAVGPLTTIVEQAEANALTMEGALAAARMAIKFIGNASVQISQERRRKAIMDMNPKLVDMAESDTIFEDAAPNLFGDKFAKEAKDRKDQLRCLDRASGRGRGNQHFRYGRPLATRRGGGNFTPRRGGFRGRGRFQPYNQFQKPKGKENYHQKGSGGAQ